jgi:hypothetical protein
MNNIQNTQNIYRLIKPYQSDKVYEAKTTLHGAGKCYRELKKSNTNCESFSIMNINDNSIYDFKINKKQEMILNKDPTELLNQKGGDELFQIKNDIQQLKTDISTIKSKLGL